MNCEHCAAYWEAMVLQKNKWAVVVSAVAVDMTVLSDTCNIYDVTLFFIRFWILIRSPKLLFYFGLVSFMAFHLVDSIPIADPKRFMVLL